jgi:hypothetical protein
LKAGPWMGHVCFVRLLETLVEGRPLDGACLFWQASRDLVEGRAFVGTTLFCRALETLVEDRPFVGACVFWSGF